MRASVVIRSKDEAARLRLTLASLTKQDAEIVVVNDGSTDGTAAVIEEAALRMPIVSVHHERPVGRSQASNIGAARASGDIVIFLDGDTLAAPDLVARHVAVHSGGSHVVGRGETFHLRGTRYFADPETGEPMPGEEARVAAMPSAEIDRLRVTLADIDANFRGIDQRAQAGIYPGMGPRLLYEMEMQALRSHPQCPALWAAASGSNQSVDRLLFEDVGGFDPDLSINEHRELALRLVQAGSRMVPVDGARTYHMTHRKGWRDPLVDREWEVRFYALHPIAEVALLSLLWSGLSDAKAGAPAVRIASIPALAEAARRYEGIVGLDAVRRAHFAQCDGLVATHVS